MAIFHAMLVHQRVSHEKIPLMWTLSTEIMGESWDDLGWIIRYQNAASWSGVEYGIYSNPIVI